MEIFKLLQRHLDMCGIAISQKTSKNHPINVKNSRILIIIYTSFVCVIVLLNEAETFDECIDVLIRSTSVGTIGVLYSIIVWKTSILFEFIKSLADVVEESEYNT